MKYQIKLQKQGKFSSHFILQMYLALLGISLLVQGVASIMLAAANIQLSGIIARLVETDTLHAAIHIIWGLGIVFLLIRGMSKRLLLRVSFLFGVFYLSLGFLGVFIHHPFGMLLRRGENIFHFLAGSIALILSIWAIKRREHYKFKA